jgi:hypothetical protein
MIDQTVSEVLDRQVDVKGIDRMLSVQPVAQA